MSEGKGESNERANWWMDMNSRMIRLELGEISMRESIKALADVLRLNAETSSADLKTLRAAIDSERSARSEMEKTYLKVILGVLAMAVFTQFWKLIIPS